MKTTGIIAEYNPFHGGHKYHIEKAKEETGSDCCIVLMSGDFVQRGEPAIFSKYLRTRMALTCGADVVIELPSVFAVSSAEDFAACGIALLTGLGVVDFVCFGSEEGDVSVIQRCAALLEEENSDFSGLLKEGLRQGLSWPAARNQALLTRFFQAQDDIVTPETMNRLLASPNNILGLEYCKAILRQKSPLTPVTILRKGQGYHDHTLMENQASASALRAALKDENPKHTVDFSRHIPMEIRPMYEEARTITAQDCSALLNFTLLNMVHQGQDFSDYLDVSPELSERLLRLLLQYESWEGRIRQLKTRQYTYTRISRVLTHLLLGITKEMQTEAKEAGFAPYARILGFRRSAAPLLSRLKKEAEIPLITKTAGVQNLLSGRALALFEQDMYASHVRQCVEAAVYGFTPRNEFNQPLCILDSE